MSSSSSDWSDGSRESREEKGRGVATKMSVCFALIAIIPLILAAVIFIFCWTRNWKLTGPATLAISDLDDLSKHTLKAHRLPRNLKPESYDLVIKTYLPAYKDVPKSRELSFDGQLTIVIEVTSSTDKIALHMKHISIIKSESSVMFGDTVIPIKKISFIKSADVGVLHLAKNILKGQKFTLRITYIGTIGTDRMTGLYLTNYTEHGDKKVAAVTQFEATHAREMVPCFDEPDLKATWNITVIHPYKTTAISNGMELTSEVDSDRSWVTTKFETTPRMSSYLVAVFVSEFTFNHLETSSGVLFRVWSRPAAINMTSFALRTGVECLAFLEKYFDIPFPLKKQDMIAVPDLLSSAMENWGMITYKESALLYDERIYPQGSEIHVIKLIAHELAHSWFGNLVTMKWWNDLWLNEGFSRYMEHIATTAILRAPRMEDFFLIDVLDTALQSDSRVASQPLLLKAEETADVLEGFGALVYDKGASLIYMIAALMGKESFKKCLQHYLKEHSYSNVETFDLWNALDAEAPKLVGPYAGKLVIRIFADQWTTQNGYPLITAESHNSTSFKVTQSRFKISPETEDPQHAKYGHKWDVPIWYQINREEVKLDWLRRDEPLYITADTARSIIVLNANRYGYYRQNYDIDGWQKLSKQLNENHEVFHTRTRNAIVADAFAAASVAQIDYATLFDLLWYLRNETEYIPLYEALAGLYAIREKLGALRVERDLFNSYLRSLLKYVHKNLQESTRTYKNLGHMYRKDKFFFDSNLKQTVINAYCEAEAKECIDKFATLFLRDVLSCGKYSRASDCVRTPAPLRGNTYCYGIERLGSEAYEKVFEMYMLETVQLEKNTLLGSLACSRNDSYLHRLLQQTFDSDFVRRQDVPVVFSALSKSNGGGKIAFNFLLENWSMIYDSLKNSDSILKNVIKTSLSNANTANELIKLDAFLKHEIGAKYIRWFNEEREKIADRVAWIKKNRDPIVEYLKSIEGA